MVGAEARGVSLGLSSQHHHRESVLYHSVEAVELVVAVVAVESVEVVEIGST